MNKKRRGLSARGVRVAKSDKDMKSTKIAFLDIPELSDRQLSSMHRVAGECVIGRPDFELTPECERIDKIVGS